LSNKHFAYVTVKLVSKITVHHVTVFKIYRLSRPNYIHTDGDFKYPK